MADENIVTNIVANADFSGLIADVNKVTASLAKLQAQVIQSDARLASQVATMNRSFGENLRRTGQFASHFVTLTSDVEKFGTNLDKGQMKLKQYFQTFQQHTKTQGGLIRELAKQQVALQNAIIQPMGKNAQGLMQYTVHIPQGLDAIKNKTALAKQELQIMNKVVQDGGVQLINWGKNTQWAGRQLTVGLTVPLAAFGKAAADAFRAADAELTRLTKVYGGVAATSSTELSKIRNEVSATAKEISKAYGVSFKDTITLAADIAATGKQGNELLASVKETSRLAVLGEVDRQDAMKATLAIQSTFKQNTDQLAESINFLNSVENQTSTSLADLIEAIPKAGPVIQGMGGSVKDLALYLTAMKEGGINAAEGTNALKSALASLINPTKVATEKFANMGIDLGGIVSKNAGNLTGTILELQKALDSLDPLQKQQAIEQLFGKFQFARMNALFANLGKQGSQTLQVMDLMKASSQELAGVAGRELSMVTESASGKYRRALEGLKADLASMGEEFLKIQTFFINVTDGILKFVNKLPGPVKSILTFVTGLTAIIGPVIMLTGVLANFFGYIIKGVSHFKALFKGGEGWKMLTPEILAAQKAGSLVETTFYNDAKAATVLKTAISGLVTEFELLQSKANAGAISVAPTLSTMAGNIVTPGGGRVVNPNHPLISPEDTRSMSHLNPVAGMTADQKAAQTIFGVVPGAPKVNQKIGNNPQIYMSGDLPKIPGLTSIGGASTGIVAEEAAKWHAMTGALAMQSQSEIALLKKEVATTGLITAELSDSYQALLPTMTKLTSNAAAESAAIVAQLQAGKITVDQARVKIIQLNAQVESMIAQASVDIAGQQGRSIGLTTVPLLNQPVVNNAGKSNMKELARPGRTRDLLNKIARGLGVKTFGAGYSTETTIPKRLNSGGYIYTANDGSIVPGPNVNADVVPAMLTPGEFVVNAKSTKENLPLLQAINGGAGSGGAGMITGGQTQTLVGMPSEFMRRINLISGVRRADSRSGRQVFSPGATNYDQMGSRAGRNSVWNNPILAAGRPGPGEVAGHIYSNQFYRQYGGPGGSGSSPRATAEEFSLLTGLNIPKSRSNYVGQYDILPNQFVTLTESFNTKLTPKIIKGKKVDPSATKIDWFANPRKPEHMLSLLDMLTSQGISERKAVGIAQQALNRINSNIARLPDNAIITERMFGNIVTNSTRVELNRLKAIGELNERQNAAKPILPRGTYTPGAYIGYNRRNSGGMIQGYNRGGKVAAALQVLSHSPINKLSQLRNYLKARSMVKKGMYHGSYGENSPALEGRNVLDSAISRDKFHGMGFYSTSSIKEAERYSEGYNTTMDGGFGTVNQIMNLPKGQYIDFRKKNLKWQNIQLYKALGGKDYKYAGEDLGPILRQLGIKGAIMPRISAGRTSDKQQDLAEWLSWADPSGVVTKELLGKLPEGRIPGRANGGPVNAGQPYMVGERGPELFVPRNSGGIIPSMQYFHQGSDGPVGFRAGYQSQTSKGYLGKGLMAKPEGDGLGMASQMGIMMGGSMLGQTVGGGTGTAITAAANILPWLPFQKILPLLKSANTGAGLLKTGLTLAGKAAGLLTRMLPGAAIIGAIFLAVKAYQSWTKSIEETRREHIMLNGITEKGAKEAGISYKNVGNSIKDVREQLKLQKEAGLSAYDSMTPSGVQGLTLTIAQLKELKKTAKETMPELVGTFNSIDSSKVNDLASNLKAQFVSAGMSVQDATNKIYAMIEASNKAGQGFGAIASSGFKTITDRSSAATAIVNTLLASLKEIDTVDSKAFASNIDTVISSLDAAATALEGTKDAQGKTITQTDALIAQFEKLNSLGASREKIGQKGLENLKKERPELAAILKSSDTIAGMYAKWRVLLAGVNIDLKNITSEQAIGIAAYETALSMAAAASTNDKNIAGALGAANKATDKLTTSIQNGKDAIKAAEKAEAGFSKAKIKAIQDEIKAIRDRADAKKKALQDSVDSENTELELKKLQLEAQSALARGDKDALDAANLSIEQLVKQTQLKKASDKIDENAKKEIDAKQKLLDADQAKKDKQQESIAKYTNNAQTAAETLNQINDIKSALAQLAIDQIENNALKDPAKKAEGQKAIDGRLQTIVAVLEKASDAVQKAFPDYVDSKTNKGMPTSTKIYGLPGGPGTSVSTGAGGEFQKLVAEIQGGAKANFIAMADSIKGGATLKNVVEAMGGKVDKSKTLKQEDVTAAIIANQGKSSGFLKDQTKDDNSLEEGVRQAIIQKYGFKDGDSFTFQGITYNVKPGKLGKGLQAVRRSLGGTVAAGQTYSINDRLNPLGAQQEGFMPFTPKVSGMIYPNADTMPRYNIASGAITGMRGGANSSSSNNTYSINIELNGTNVTADDVMRRFKQELALVNAKEGISRSVGGSI